VLVICLSCAVALDLDHTKGLQSEQRAAFETTVEAYGCPDNCIGSCRKYGTPGKCYQVPGHACECMPDVAPESKPAPKGLQSGATERNADREWDRQHDQSTPKLNAQPPKTSAGTTSASAAPTAPTPPTAPKPSKPPHPPQSEADKKAAAHIGGLIQSTIDEDAAKQAKARPRAVAPLPQVTPASAQKPGFIRRMLTKFGIGDKSAAGKL